MFGEYAVFIEDLTADACHCIKTGALMQQFATNDCLFRLLSSADASLRGEWAVAEANHEYVPLSHSDRLDPL